MARFEDLSLEEFCWMMNNARSTDFVLKKVKVVKADRKKGLGLIGLPPQVFGVITIIAGGDKREFHFEASEFEVIGE